MNEEGDKTSTQEHEKQENGCTYTPLFFAVIPFLGYFFLYRFEQGYLGYFGAPDFFISIGSERFVSFFSESFIQKAFMGVSGLVVAGFCVLVLSLQFPKILKFSFWVSWIGIVITLTIPIIVLMILIGDNPFYFEMFFRAAIFFMVLWVVAWASSGEHYNISILSNRKIYKRIQSVLWHPLFIFVYLSLFVIAPISFERGYSVASTQRDFFSIRRNKKDYVVLRNYGEQTILAELYNENKLKNIYIALNSDSINGIPIEKISVKVRH